MSDRFVTKIVGYADPLSVCARDTLMYLSAARITVAASLRERRWHRIVVAVGTSVETRVDRSSRLRPILNLKPKGMPWSFTPDTTRPCTTRARTSRAAGSASWCRWACRARVSRGTSWSSPRRRRTTAPTTRRSSTCACSPQWASSAKTRT